jgi:hypothetical protein
MEWIKGLSLCSGVCMELVGKREWSASLSDGNN